MNDYIIISRRLSPNVSPTHAGFLWLWLIPRHHDQVNSGTELRGNCKLRLQQYCKEAPYDNVCIHVCLRFTGELVNFKVRCKANVIYELVAYMYTYS